MSRSSEKDISAGNLIDVQQNLLEDPGYKSKKQLIDVLANLPNAIQFEFDTLAILEISEKPTYQVEVVALFQEAKSNTSR